MKLSLCLSLITLTVIATAPSASAQEARGARFNYAPNVWKNEASRLPKGYGDYHEPAHNVQSGAVPTKNLLGLDPMMLSKPAPMPAAQPQVSSQVMAPTTSGNFNPSFGKPIVAQLPSVVPQQAAAQSMARPVPVQAPVQNATQGGAPKAPATNIAPVARRPMHTNSVRARLKAPAYRPTRPVQAVAQSYPTNFGYVPGTILTKSAPTKATQEVHGVLRY